MRNIQKLSSQIQTTIRFRTTILFLFGGLGVLFVLFILTFVFYNLGRTEDSHAAGSISSIKSGIWTDNMVWNLHRKPGNHEEIIIGREELVTINSNVLLQDVTLKVYGTLTLANGKLRLDENSTILVAKTGEINTTEGSNSIISFATEGASWVGNQINSIGAPGQLTFSGESSVDLLPVQLAYFRGTVTDDGHALLEWQTLSEQNNSFFTIEKRRGDNDFIFLDTVAGAGTSNSLKKYQYTDRSFIDGSILYRLKQTDFDGNSEYFDIINVTGDHSKDFLQAPSLKIFQAGPNPFNDSFTISYNSTGSEKIEINILTIGGEIVHTEMVDSSQGENKYTFRNSNKIASGLYIVTLANKEKSDFIKMVKM